MIVSHRHKFIFLKTRKTAGTSIEVALSRLCGEMDIITPIGREDEAVRQQLGYRGPQNYTIPVRRYGRREWRRLLADGRRTAFYNHIPAHEARPFLSPRIWNSYYKFCFERNPWDRIVSAYFFRRYQTNDAALTFQSFLDQQRPHVLSNYGIYAIEGRVAVDFVGRYERLVEDLQKALAYVGITEPIVLPRLKASARTDKRPYREIITPEQRRFIEERCHAEIELLHYRFEEPATARG